MKPARFNVFQRVLRDWDALHPYNAAQILHLRGSPDLNLLTEQWNRSLKALGIGAVHVEGKKYWIDHPNSAQQQLCSPQNVSLSQFITDEMNRPFPQTGGLPFRPFVLKQADSYLAGIVYHHWVADSASIRTIMREWFVRCFDPSRVRNEALPIADGGYWRYFGPHTSRWKFDVGFLQSMSWFSRFRRVRRIESERMGDFNMRFTLHHFPAGAIERIHATARAHGVTVNDLFLAAMAQACDRYVPAKRTFRRHDLALGTIVDLRARGKHELGDAFGLFLGFTSVFVRPHELENFDRMLQSISRQTQLHKRTGTPEASMMRMVGGTVFHRIFAHDTKKLVNFYRKRFPLCAGISNVNLKGSWIEQYHPDPLINYIRVSPTGPMMPVVFTTTTLGEQLHFGLSTRDSIISPEDANAMAELFKEILLSGTERL